MSLATIADGPVPGEDSAARRPLGEVLAGSASRRASDCCELDHYGRGHACTAFSDVHCGQLDIEGGGSVSAGPCLLFLLCRLMRYLLSVIPEP
jgi:hypothetical protein